MATIAITLTGYKVGYFSSLGWAYELISTLSILGLCTFEFSYNKLSVSISEMSYAIYLSHLALTELADIRKNTTLMPYLRPDAKSQFTIEYNDNDEPVRIHTIVLSTQRSCRFMRQLH